MRIVIVGNGVAGMEAALAVRAAQPSWKITIVSEESDHFVSRTALMYVFCGQLRHRDIEPLERDAYQRFDLERVRARAIGVDADEKKLLLAGGEALPYDRLLIACGSSPRPGPWPGSDLRGVGHFVTLQDLEWLEREVHGGPSHGGRPPNPDAHLSRTDETSPYRPRPVRAEACGATASKPLVIGGGLIGIEAVEILVAAGHEPAFVIREEWFWPIALDRRESTWIAERMREHGVDVKLEANVEALLGEDGNLVAAQTDVGRIETDLAIVAIGVVPNTRWLESSKVERQERDGAILVDRSLRTNLPDVFAAGDCAAVAWYDGAVRPEQLWYTARDQGRVAARSLLGQEAEYARGTWYNSAKLFDIEYTTAGLVGAELEGELEFFHEETGPVRSTTRIVTQGSGSARFVVGFNLLGRRWDHAILCEWIEAKKPLSWVLTHLNEASFDTEFVPPLVLPAQSLSHTPTEPRA